MYTYDVVHYRGETVSVPKGGDLPRPSVAGIIEGPESSIIESECHRPISFKDDVEVSHHESEDVALQQNDDPNSLSLKSAAELNRNKNEQVIGVVEESSPRYKSDIVEMDVENVEDQHIEEKEASAVNSALPASSVSSDINMKNTLEFPNTVKVVCGLDCTVLTPERVSVMPTNC